MALQDLSVYLSNLLFPSVQQIHHLFMLPAFADISPSIQNALSSLDQLVSSYSLKLYSNVILANKPFQIFGLPPSITASVRTYYDYVPLSEA